MGKGSNTTSTTSSNTSAPDPQAAAAYRDILTRAQGVAGTPYQAYTGNLTADVNSQQNTGISGINANAGFASPYIQQAAGMAGQAAAPISAGDIQHYMDPYTQQVVDATTGQLMHDFGQQGAQLTGNQISQGALGGNATGVARGVLGGQQARTLASTTAGLYSQGFDRAMQAAQRQQATGLQGANSIANYGISGQGAALSGAGQQVAAGTLQQQTEQAKLNALYGQYAQAQAYPYQQTQWLAGIDTGVGSNLGGTNWGSGTSTAPAPNQTAQWLGLGLSAASLLSDRRAKEDVEHIGKMNDGTPIYRFRYKGSQQMHVGPMAQDVERRNPDAVSRGVDGMRYVDMEEATDDSVAHRADGGGVGGIPWGGAQGWIPTMAIHGGSGAPGAGHAPSSPSSGQSAFDPSKLGAGVAGLKNSNLMGNIGQFFSPEAYGDSFGGGSGVYGGSSSNPLPGMDALDYGEGFADGGGVMSDADPVGISPGQRTAQAAGPYLIRPNQDGTHSVVNTRTGQIHFTGTPSGASNAQASLIYRSRARGGGVDDYPLLQQPWLRNVTPEPQPDLMNGDPAWTDPAYNSDAPDNVRNGDPAWDVAGVPTPRSRPEQTFSDRFAPASEGVAAGTMQARDDTVVNPGNPVRLQGSTYGPQGAPAVAADDEEEDTTPANAAPTSGRGVAGKPPSYYDRPDSVRPREREGWGLGLLSPNAQTGLLTAGLGMLASRSPNLGNAVGEGALAGVGAYGAAEERDRQVAVEAAKLSREADKTVYDRWMGERKQGETERHNLAGEAYQKKNLDRSKWVPAGQYMGEDGVYRPVVMNSATGDMKDAVSQKPLTGNEKIVDKKDVGGFTEEDAKKLAIRYVASGDRTLLQGLGTTGAAKLKVQRAIDKVMDEQKVTPEEMAQRTVEWEARKAAGRSLGVQEAKMGSAAFEAEGAIKLARGVIEKLPRTSFLPFNRLIEGFSKNTLNPDQAELAARAQAIVNTYSAVMARGANVTTDSSRHHAADLLNTAYDPVTFNRILDTMLVEIEMAKHSPAKMQAYYRKLYGPKSVEQGTGSGGGPPIATQPPKFTPPADALVRQYNGKTYYYDPNTKQPYPGQ